VSDQAQQTWLNEYLTVREALLVQLGMDPTIAPFTKRYEVVYSLARGLGFDPDALTWPSLGVLADLVMPLGDALAALRGNWAEFVQGEHHRDVARLAGRDLDAERLIIACRELRCGDARIDCRAREVQDALREVLQRELANRIARLVVRDDRRRKL
jgi:hypothetical protein